MSETVLTARILGCGSSGGVPRVGNRWGDCDPKEPKNRRRRCSLLVSATNDAGKQTTVLVDTSPDLREQLLDANCEKLDALVFTHDHADQTHGVDDLRPLCYRMGKRIPAYLDERTAKTLSRRFEYVFHQLPGTHYPAIVDRLDMPPLGRPFQVSGDARSISITPFLVDHGPDFQALGFRFGSIAYTPDVSNIPQESLEALQGIDVWIVDALRRTPHPTHFNLDLTLQWIERIKPKRAVLTNMHIDMDYQTLCQELPDHVVPAFDGMEIESKA